MKKTLIALAMIFFAMSTTVSAENLMQDTIYLDTISVTGEPESNKDMQSTNVRVHEVKRSNNIADFLEDDPEISLKRKTLIGDSGDVLTIRGQSGQRILLNLDGRNMNSTGTNGGNYIDFSTIPLDNIEKIEVIKGGSSAEYGNNAIGGVINAYTFRPATKPKISLYGTMGWWDEDESFNNIRGSYSQKFGPVGLSLGASYQEADEYLWNNDYRSTHIAPKLYIDTPWDGELILGYDYTKTYRGMIKTNRVSSDPDDPGYHDKINSNAPLSLGETFAGGAGGQAMSVIGDGAHYDKIKHMYTASYTQYIGTKAFVELSTFMNREDRMDKNYADKTTTAAGVTVSEGDLVLDRTVEVDRSYGFKGKTEIYFEKHKLNIGAEQKNMKAGEIDVDYVAPAPWTGSIASSDSGPRIRTNAVFLSDSWDITDKLTFDIGARYDQYDALQHKDVAGTRTRLNYDDESITPKAGITYSLTNNDKVSVYIYQSYRTPTIPEMNHFVDAQTVPLLENSELSPEKADAVDIAYKHNFANNAGHIKLSAFYYDIDDYLLMGSNPITNKGRITYNIDNAVFKGVSAEGRYNINPKISINAGVAFQDSEKSGDPVTAEYADYSSDNVDYIPDIKGTAGVIWKINDKLTLDTELIYVGEREYFYYSKTRELDPYYLLGTSLSWEFAKNTTVEFYLDNIFDEDYEEQYGYPAIGLNGGVSLKWTY
ncbi:TonB-dependent receptor [Denitrovibrio acetiphilus DSM 12809]|uniref:TonB-dependent receptor n=1 Tax=Denitrovibrio acetiphilus (strain DSM 12809 / NBRC 114555 / N2460) TaxID=522772 RepID=D4H6Q0_DENA2|nr:TonB-dependent receptor [Denitrovibrio acetiphilus]ADD67766.1 TonB-dependent receptor [Denitrovibrio acetiphilus DSM 12809]